MEQTLSLLLWLVGSVVVTAAVLHTAAVVMVAAAPKLRLPFVILTITGVGGVVLLTTSTHGGEATPVLLTISATTVYLMHQRQQLFAAGALLWSSFFVLVLSTLLWGVVFLASLNVSLPTMMLLVIVAGLGAVSMPSVLVQTREGWEPLLRRTWRRPRSPLPSDGGSYYPKVSVHVPCHAEPPEVVIATLESIAALDYPDLEVLVIDNNTYDEALWRPLEAACERLGERFRLLHVVGIDGAKAGALNWALPQAHPEAEVIAVVDADYQVRSDWLRSTIGFFEDPRMGFVQSPHAYRDFEAANFGRWANWEYSVFFATGMVSLNEHNAGLTVGTMSLVRREALEEVGGWAEWCLTEDSELAIRVHAAGYDSVYVAEAYGRGLIPETFAGYRKQRFRWTYGPVQELKRHWRLFLPNPWRTPSALDRCQRLHHANHGLDVIFIGLRALGVPFAAAAAGSMAIHGEAIRLPIQLLVAATAVMVSRLVLRWVIYRRVVKATVRQALGGMVAFAGLSHVIVVASLCGLLGRPARWHRTDKFRCESRGIVALLECRAEVLIGTIMLGASVLLMISAPGGMVTMLAIGLAMQAVPYFAAPAVALVADRDVRRSGVTLAEEAAAAQQSSARAAA